MVAEVFDLISSCFSAGVLWLDHIFIKSGFSSVFIGVMSIILLYRFLLSPVFGRSSASDRAKKKTSGGDK